MKTLKSFLLPVIFAAATVCVVGGCATYHNPLTGKDERTLYSTEDEVALGKQVATEIEKKQKLSDDSRLNALVARVGKKVAAKSDRPDLPYQFKVIKSKDINAFALPGGFIYAHDSLVKQMSEDELACVLGHEVGHVVARHGVKKLEANLGYSLSTIVATVIFGEQKVGQVTRFSDDFFNLIVLGYGRRDELQSDRLAIHYAQKAGYKPEAMISTLEKLKKAQKGAEPIPFLSTHPPIDMRIEEARAELARMKSS